MHWLDTQIGMAEIVGPDGLTQEIPTYVCAHCNDAVALNPNRTRERKKCQRCRGLICEFKPVCQTECVPVVDIFRDHFVGDLGPRARAILAGAQTTEEVDRLVAA